MTTYDRCRVQKHLTQQLKKKQQNRWHSSICGRDVVYLSRLFYLFSDRARVHSNSMKNRHSNDFVYFTVPILCLKLINKYLANVHSDAIQLPYEAIWTVDSDHRLPTGWICLFSWTNNVHFIVWVLILKYSFNTIRYVAIERSIAKLKHRY